MTTFFIVNSTAPAVSGSILSVWLGSKAKRRDEETTVVCTGIYHLKYCNVILNFVGAEFFGTPCIVIIPNHSIIIWFQSKTECSILVLQSGCSLYSPSSQVGPVKVVRWHWQVGTLSRVTIQYPPWAHSVPWQVAACPPSANRRGF